MPAHRAVLVIVFAVQRQRGSNFTIGYRVTGTFPKRPASSMPGSSVSSSSSKARSMQQFEFAPVETPYGKFKISVNFQPASTVTLLEQTTTPPPLPQIISNYVGGVRPPGQPQLRPTVSASLHTEHEKTLQAYPSNSVVPVVSGGIQRQASGFTPLPRHSWSSSAMRISPNRLASPNTTQPQRQHISARPELTPYGSAPQMVIGDCCMVQQR